jgi:transcriptional regulator GlxA family with amidase domain
MEPSIGILIFEDVEELDFVGPWEVLTARPYLPERNRVLTIAAQDGPVRCAKGLRVLPDCSFQNAPELDVLLVPGGEGTRSEKRGVLVDWIRKVAPRARWLTSVCTGAFLLQEAGLLEGKRVTTHWAFIEELRKCGNLTVLENRRYVRDGNVVTAAGVSAGIDMALWLSGQLHGVDVARKLQRFIEYDPAPPYSADV